MKVAKIESNLDAVQLPAVTFDRARAPRFRIMWIMSESRVKFCNALMLVLALSGPTSFAAVDELQAIVVMCATEPHSVAFAQAWQAWVVDHPDADITSVVDDVVRRAATIRSFARGGGQFSGERLRDGEVHGRMTQLARQAMSVPPGVRSIRQ